METKADVIEKELIEKLKVFKDRDLRFFRMDEYIRMIHRVEEFGDSCVECRNFSTAIEKQNETIVEAIGHPGKERRALDRLQSDLQKHMRQVHGFYPPYYFTYLYSFIWIVILSVLAWLLSYLFKAPVRTIVILSGVGLGFVVGQIIGGRKDTRIRVNKKIL